jgi:hypothetical protein
MCWQCKSYILRFFERRRTMKKCLLVMMVLCLFAGIVSADLRVWYKFDETSGLTVSDSSGNGFHTSISGTTAEGWDPDGAFGGALQNDSTYRKMWLEVPDAVFATVDTAITVAWWVQRTDATAAAAGGWFNGLNPDGQDMIRAIPYKSGDDYYLPYRAGSTSTKWWYPYGANSEMGVWDHFALVYDEAAGIKKLYFNGEVVTSPGIEAGDSIAGIKDFKIFSRTSKASPDWWDCFHGKMDDFRIYDNALTDSEVMALVPEPTTIALLGLGGLALIRRKRS